MKDENGNELDRYTQPTDHGFSEGWVLWSKGSNGPWEPMWINYDEEVRNWFVVRDGVRGPVPDGYTRPGVNPSQAKLTLEEASMIGAHYSPYGYVIDKGGETYSLVKYATHGVIAAVLRPELAKEKGFCAPVSPLSDNDVFLYQAFELDNYQEMGLIRISTGGMRAFAVSKGEGSATPQQIEAFRKVVKEHGLHPREKVIYAGYKETNLVGAVKFLEKEDPYA